MSDFRDFYRPDEIRDLVTRSDSYENEGIEEARVLLLFKTLTQQTWLIATNRRLYCIVDDRRFPAAQMRWAMPLSEARAGPITTREPDRKYRDRAGLLNIGRRRDWIYTKQLFSECDVVDAVKELIA